MAKQGKISREDLDLILVTDDPDEAVEHVVDRYQIYQTAYKSPKLRPRPKR